MDMMYFIMNSFNYNEQIHELLAIILNFTQKYAHVA